MKHTPAYLRALDAVAAMQPDKTMLRLVNLTWSTNLVALDKTLFAVRSAAKATYDKEGVHRATGYDVAASRCSAIAERMHGAVFDIACCLPVEWRTRKPTIGELS